MSSATSTDDGLERPAESLARRLAILDAVIAATSEAIELPALLERALEAVSGIAGVDGGGIWLVDEISGDLRLLAHRGVSQRLVDSFIAEPGETLAALTSNPDGPVIVEQVPFREHRPEIDEEGIQSYVAIPLRVRQSVIGVLIAVSRTHTSLSAADVDLLVSIGKQVGGAVERARLYERERRRAQQLATISEVARQLGAIRTERQLLPRIVRFVHERLGYEGANLFLVDEARGDMVLEGASGMGRDSLPGFRLPLDDGSITGWVAGHAEPVLANDVSREPRYFRGPAEEETRAELSVPIRAGGRTLGVLDVQSTRTDVFYETDVDALQTLAGQIAVAIENARLAEDTERSLSRVRAFQGMVTAVTASLHLPRTLEHALEAAMTVFDADRAAIFLRRPEDGALRSAASRNMSGAYLQAVYDYYDRVPLPADFFSVAAPRSAYLEDAQVMAYSPELAEAARREGFHSMIFLFLRAGGPVLGTFNIYHDRIRHYSKEEIALAQTFADQAAIAIQHAQLFERERRAREQAATILEATRTVTSSLRLDEVLRRSTACIAAALGQECSVVWLLDEDGDEFLSPVGIATSAENEPHGEYGPLPSVALAEMPRLRALLKDGYPVLVGAANGDDRSRLELDAAMPVRAYVAVPLVTREQAIGVTAIPLTDADRRVEPPDLEVAMAIARSAALAVENARLYEQSQRLAVSEERNRLARELHDSVTHSLFSMTMIVQALPRLMDRDLTRARERVERLHELSRGALAEMRALIFELRPAALEDEGLAVALEKHLAAFRSREAIVVELSVSGARRLPVAVEEAVFRVTQEALNNIAKHAHATRVQVELTIDDELLDLIVHDNGVGFDPAGAASGRRSLGLTSMHERTIQVGGTCLLSSVPGEGTTVHVQVPVECEPGTERPGM